jgi:hypothetical protein
MRTVFSIEYWDLVIHFTFQISVLHRQVSMHLVIPRKLTTPKCITPSSYRASIHYILMIFPSPKLKWMV